MKRTINYIVCILLVSFMLLSCSSEPTLQRYFVDHQETKNFISQDVPLSMLNIDQSKLNETQQDAFKSVKRLNFIGYKLDETNINIYNEELTKVKTILKNDQYNELIEFSDQGRKISIKYIGTDEKADEVILLGSSKDLGFAIVRVLGNDMSPEKIYSLIEGLKDADFDTSQFEGIANFFK